MSVIRAGRFFKDIKPFSLYCVTGKKVKELAVFGKRSVSTERVIFICLRRKISDFPGQTHGAFMATSIFCMFNVVLTRISVCRVQRFSELAFKVQVLVAIETAK